MTDSDKDEITYKKIKVPLIRDTSILSLSIDMLIIPCSYVAIALM